MYLFYEKNNIVWGSQKIKFLLPKQLKECVCKYLRGSNVSKWTFSNSQGQTVDAEYYVEDILEKEVKPLLKKSKRTNEATTNKMVVNKRRFTFQQDGAPAHTSKYALDWCLQHLPNFINKDNWPGNSPDLNPMENLFSILNEKVYCDPEHQTLDELKKRIRKAWRGIIIDCHNPFCTVCRNA